MSASDDELDNILDDALDSFQEAEKKAKPAPAAAPASTSTASEPEKSGDPLEEANKEEEVAMRSFLEALKSPLMQPGEGSAAQEEEDMKLVEEFVRGLENLNMEEQGDQAQQATSGAENFIKSIMQDMLSKEVLMEPIAQIRDGLKKVVEDMSEGEERTQTEAQLDIASELCREFEGDADMEKIIHLLAKLKDSGKLPSQVVAELPEEEGNRDGLEDLANCPVQ